MIDFLLNFATGICFLIIGCIQPPSWLGTFYTIASGISFFNAGIDFCDYTNKKNKKNKGE